MRDVITPISSVFFDVKNKNDNNNISSNYCNNISYLPEYPMLQVLNCFRNELSELGDYPLLNYLECDYNELREIPLYPLLKVL